MRPYPLSFEPVMKERVWGGRALEQFDFQLPEGPIGEAWLIGDHPHGTTRVANGPLRGQSLSDIRRQYGAMFMGAKGIASDDHKFPLLVKLLDCEDDLSIQVHPSDGYEKLPAGENGKTEMWYIVAAKPDAKIIYGLRENIDRTKLTELIAQGQIMDGLQEVPVKAGDSFYIPAGTVHALGAGVLVAEIQQNSDTVYRLYDYNRPGLDGQPRELHIDDSLNVINYHNEGASRIETGNEQANEWLCLAKSPYFVVEKGTVKGETPWLNRAFTDTFTIMLVCEGKGTLSWHRDDEFMLQAGACLLLPAGENNYTIQGNMTVLRSYLP